MKKNNFNINGTDIYNRISYLIKNKNLQNNDLYKKVGITRQHLARWKKGSLPSVDILYSISNELNISLEWLLTGNGKCLEQNEKNIQIENVKKEIIFLLDTLK